MKSKYEVVEFRVIAKKNLKKHPAAELPMMDDDKAALKSSIEARGIIQPLLVLEEGDDKGFFLVVDGCNRLDSAPADADLPCMLIRTDDPRAVALECLATGRRRTTGQRIMVYLMMHKKEVLKAAELGARFHAGNPSAVSRETAQISGIYADFTTEAIAERLQVSKEDVVRAVELFRCSELGLHPSVESGDKKTVERPLDTEEEADRLAEETTKRVFNGVLAGGTAVRKWKSAWNGRQKTTGPQGRPNSDPADLFERGLKHMRTVLDASTWHGIHALQREFLADLFSDILEKLPEELKVRMVAFVEEEEAKKKAEAEASKKRIGA